MSQSLRGLIFKLVVFTAFSLLLSTIVFSTLLNSSSQSQRGFAAEFSNASGLRSGNDVRIAGVKVGKISKVELKDGHARVSFQLDTDQKPTSTTKVAINYANLLGQRFVNLLPGETAGEPLKTGSVIPMDRTAPGLDLTEVFNGFQPLFSALSPEQVNKLSASIVQVFQGQSGTVQSLFQQTAIITNDLAGRQELINSVLGNLAKVLTDVGAHDQQLGQLIDNFNSLLTGLSDSREQLGEAVTGLSAVTTGLGNVLGQSQPALSADIARLNEVTQTLNQNQGAVDATIKGLPGLLTTLTKPMSTGSYLNVYLCNLTVNLVPTTPVAGDDVPLVISLIPGVDAQPNGDPIAPNPVLLPKRTVIGGSTTQSAVCAG